MRLLAGLLLVGLFALPTTAAADPGHHQSHRHHPGQRHHHQHPPRVPCSRGLVALTFDDGPSASVTPRLVRTLQRLDVPATFFMVGSRVVTAPEAARLVADAGFAIGNHTWAHSDLTTQTGPEIRTALRDTRRELRRVGITPTHLARPPYGAVDDRVRRVLGEEGYVPVLWTVDSRDWAGGPPRQIVRTVLAEVRPHPTRPEGNLVLQHDGVTNSPATVRALPTEVRRLERRGYCFAALDTAGHPTPPVPSATVTSAQRVVEGGSARVTVTLDRPTSRATSVLVRTEDVSTGTGDVGWQQHRVRFGVGATVAQLRLPALLDGLDEPREEVLLRIDTGDGVAAPGIPQASITVVDGDGPPEVAVTGGVVTESATERVVAPVGVRLSHVSGRVVRVHLRTAPGTTDDLTAYDGWVSVPAGAHRAPVPMTVLPGPVDERTDTVGVRLVASRHADPAPDGSTATVTVRPATSPPAPARMRRAHPGWC